MIDGLQQRAVPVAGWVLMRNDLGLVAALMAALVGFDMILELLGRGTSAGAVGMTLLIWAFLLWRFHVSALGQAGPGGFNRFSWAFLWRFLMTVLLLVFVPVVIVTLFFVGGLQRIGSEQEVPGLIFTTGIIGLPLLIVSLTGLALVGMVFPLIVDRGRGTFRQAIRLSRGKRGWMFIRLLIWTFGPNFLPFALIMIVSQQYSDANFLDPTTHEPNIRLIMLAFINNCLSAFGTACGAAIFSRVYLAKRDSAAAGGDASMPEG